MLSCRQLGYANVRFFYMSIVLLATAGLREIPLYRFPAGLRGLGTHPLSFFIRLGGGLGSH